MKITIATRRSPLALWQANHVASLLRAEMPGLDVAILELTTKGDKILDQALSKVGGKDLFVKEIEDALIDRRADVAVHSLKDMPTELPPGLSIAAHPPREDPRDALVAPQGYTLATLPQRAKVGTSSLRRAAQLLRKRPDLVITPIRGNVQTRLRKVEEQGLAGTLLAYAGLKRLGLAHLASEVIAPEVSLPAIGQGILAVETRSDDAAVNALVAKLDDRDARTAAVTERAFLHRLRGGCQVPIAAHARISGASISLVGLVASVDGKQIFEGQVSGDAARGSELGVELAEKLLADGAGAVLDVILGH